MIPASMGTYIPLDVPPPAIKKKKKEEKKPVEEMQKESEAPSIVESPVVEKPVARPVVTRASEPIPPVTVPVEKSQTWLEWMWQLVSGGLWAKVKDYAWIALIPVGLIVLGIAIIVLKFVWNITRSIAATAWEITSSATSGCIEGARGMAGRIAQLRGSIGEKGVM
jgi:hypothetical protein